MRFPVASSLAAIAFVLIPAGVARAQGMYSPNPNPTTASAEVTSIDTNFVMKAVRFQVEEVRQAQLQQTSRDFNASAYANQILKDFNAPNQRLNALATQAGMGGALYVAVTNAKAPVPSSPQTYFTNELAAHQNAIALYQQEAKKGEDERFRSFAQQMVPLLQRETQLAQRYLTP